MALHPFAARILGTLGLSTVGLAGACGGIAILDTNQGGAGGDGGSGGAPLCVPTLPVGAAPFQGVCLDECVPAGSIPAEAVLPVIVFPDECASACGGCTVNDVVGQCIESKPDGSCCYSGYYTYDILQCGGRPLSISGKARVAPVASRAGWSGASHEPRVDVDGFSAPTPGGRDATLAASWAQDAAFEHASVGSFAAHVLELLAVGAPAELVRAAQRGLSDEIEHARLCFAIASRHAGEELGPGPLDLRGLSPRTTLAEVAAATVAEGCVNETIAALLARRELETTTDPVVRAALERIASDEERHAELAWRVVAWALERGDEDVRSAIARAFESAAPHPGEGTPGRLSTNERAAVAAEAVRGVIEPCARALLSQTLKRKFTTSPSFMT